MSYIWLIKASKAVERRLTLLTLINYYFLENSNSAGEMSKIKSFGKYYSSDPAESIM